MNERIKEDREKKAMVERKDVRHWWGRQTLEARRNVPACLLYIQLLFTRIAVITFACSA